MVETLIYCDRCRGAITEGRSLLTATAGPTVKARPTVDSCRDCLDAFALFLAGGPFLDSQVPPTPMRLGVSA